MTYYRIGDAVRFAEEGDPARGLVFDGRVAEDSSSRAEPGLYDPVSDESTIDVRVTCAPLPAEN